MKLREYFIIIEPTVCGFSAYCPDLPGCITVGKTVEETTKNMHEAIKLYMEELIGHGEVIPAPKTIKQNVLHINNVKTGTFFTNMMAGM